MGFRQCPLEDLEIMNASFWHKKSVFLTGHTGFKGGWLSLWLNKMGANVHGYSLDPCSDPALFNVADIPSVLASDTRADLADLNSLKQALKSSKPEIIFHLAAQSLVRESYVSPLNTLVTNIMGTANLLEATREIESVQAVLIVTSDKVYQNTRQEPPFKELDLLGGQDPYSASKAATEIVTAAYRNSFFDVKGGHPAQIATARAGNVIGGGDWATDRLVPDCFRAFAAGEPVSLRYPNALRPWQHVLDPLSGYLILAEKLLSETGTTYAKAWKFGPIDSDNTTVYNVAELAARLWGDGASVAIESHNDHPHEADQLKLNSAQSRNELGWKSRWDLNQALDHTVRWHQDWTTGSDMKSASERQIEAYSSTLPI